MDKSHSHLFREVSPVDSDVSSVVSHYNVGGLQNLSIVSPMAAPICGPNAINPNMGTISVTAQSFTDRARDEINRAHSAEGSSEGGEPTLATQTDPGVTNVEVVKGLMFTGAPLTLAFIAQFLINAAIIAISGKLVGVEEMGGATLALGLMNATGFAFGTGLCGALETVLSHTYGRWKQRQDRRASENINGSVISSTELNSPLTNRTHSTRAFTGQGNASNVQTESTDNLFMFGTYAQRMSFILLAAALPLGVIMCFADSLLKSMGEGPVVIYYMGRWCRFSVFGIPAAMTLPLLQRYYSCQHSTKPLLVATLIASIVNPGLQIGFVKAMGYDGSPVAWLILITGLVLGLVGYLRWSGMYRLTWGGWNKRGLQNVGGLVKLALPSMGIMLCEWVVVEIIALVAGFAPATDLAAFSISLQVFGVMWGVSSGIIIITCVFVGNAVGAGKPLFGRRIAFISIVLVACISLADIVIIFALNSYIPYIFTNDHNVAKAYQKVMYIVLPYHIFDTFQSTMMAIFRGCKLQRLGAVLIFVALCVVGTPLSLVLFFFSNLGVLALWIGLFVGVAVIGTPTYLVILLWFIDWRKLRPHAEDTVHRAE